jgi:hypothetical protein
LITNNLSSATTQTTLEALQALLQIEVKFAALRDQLYVERMDELSREEEIIADGKLIDITEPCPFVGGRADVFTFVTCRNAPLVTPSSSDPSR